MIKICHLTSAHTRYDVRILVKECSSLAKIAHYDVSLIVADNLGNERKNNINIYDVGKFEGRLNRIFRTTKKVLKKAIELDADIYHLHDPELIPAGVQLKKLGKKVIFDAHEDVPKQLLGKPYLNKALLKILSKSFSIFESYACKKFDFIVTATPFIKNKFLQINKNSLDINNYPIIGELAIEVSWSEKKDEVCYIGNIAKIRGIEEVVKAMEFTKNIKFNLAGRFTEKEVEEEVKSYHSWAKINEFGNVDRVEVAKILGISKAGIVTFYPLPNHVDSQPNKMFEYMSAGLPIIISDFPFWREIVDKNRCGICVDPMNPEEIAKAIDFIISNPKEAEKMGLNGKKAVIEKYNWPMEESKLLKIYKELE